MRVLNLRPSPLLVAGVAAAVSLLLGVLDHRAPAHEPLAGDVRVHGEVVRVEAESSGDTVDLRTSGRLVRVQVSGSPRVGLGDHLDAWLHLAPITRYENPSPALPWPAPRESPESRGRLVTMAARTEAPGSFAPSRGSARADSAAGDGASHASGGGVRVVRRSLGPSAVLARLVDPIRRAMRDGQRATLAPRAARLGRAMVLGDARALTDDERSVLSRAGLAHLVAVSGLNVVLVVGALVWVIRALLRRIEALAAAIDVNRVAASTAIPLGAAFAALTGFQPSAIRAAVMTAIAGALVAVGRRSRGAPVLGATVIAALLVDPEAARRPGFLLSVVATAGLLRLVRGELRPRETRWVTRAVGHVRALVTTNVRATLATAPIVLWLFGELPAVGLLANLVAVPATSIVLLPVALVQAALGALWRPAGALVAPLVDGCADAFFAGAELAARAPTISFPPWTATQVVAATVATGAALWPNRLGSWRARSAAAIVALALAGAAEARLRIWPRGQTLRVTFLDVAQGDSTLVELPDGRRILVDAGDAYAGERSVVPFLRAHRIEALDLLVVTHPHPDHYGGVEAIARAVGVREIWDNGQAGIEDPDGAWAKALARFRAGGTRVRNAPDVCRESPFAGVTVLAPCPDRDPDDEPNDASIVLRLDHRARSFLLTGDIEARAEERLVRTRTPALRADVLKVPHHGSRTSSGPSFLRAVRPSWAIASAGRGNRFHHPHSAVEARYVASAIGFLDTRRCGGVVVETDGDRLDIRPTLPCQTDSAITSAP